MKKIIITNLILLLIIFLAIEGMSYFHLYSKYKNDIEAYNKITKQKNIFPMKYQKVTTATKEDLINNLRNIEYGDENKKPIILFGCSYVYGFGLEENQTFSYKLSQSTNRTVVNRGRSGTGLPFFYFQLSDDEIKNKLPKNPEYIIYTLIPDHFPRLYRYRNFVLTGDHTLKYKLSDDKLVIEEPKIKPIHSLFSAIVFEEYLSGKKYAEDSANFQLFKKLMDESVNIMKKDFPNTKFVILYYKGPYDFNENIDNVVESYTKTKGVTLINVHKEFPNIQKDKNCWLEDNAHPSEHAWDLIVPMIIKKLNLNSEHH